MVSSNNNNNREELGIIYGKKLSSVGPGRVTGDLSYQPCTFDFAMKLHYLRIVYIFEAEEFALDVLRWPNFKEAIFSWLCYYYESCGRFRNPPPEHGDRPPYIKCNDCGIRFVEAKSSKTIEEWLQLKDDSPHQRLLVPDHVIASDLTFSPHLFLQITSFKCGGMSVGLSWSHILGDPFSASNFMNSLGQFLKGQEPTYPPNLKKSPHNTINKPITQNTSGPLSLKQVSPLDGHWAFPPPCDMDTFSFHVTGSQLAQLKVKMSKSDPIGHFEALSAVIWWAIAKVKDGPNPDTITIITKGSPDPRPEDMLLRNNQIISSVRAHFSIAKAHPEELAILIRDEAQYERAQIEHKVGQSPEGSDFIVYGSNPTFVDWGEVGFYGFEFKGIKPKLVNCFVDGIGGEGVVLVLPSPRDDTDEGRIVTLILPNKYMGDLKEELHNEWGLIA